MTVMENRNVLYLPALLLGSFILYVVVVSPGWLELPGSSSSSSRPNGNPPKLTELLVAQQRSMALLLQQGEGLLGLWNTIANSSSIQGHSDSLKSQILTQIRLNKETRQALLSPYSLQQSASFNDTPQNFPLCSRVANTKYKVKPGLGWKSTAGKYLFTVCTSGQFSNHLICVQKHMFIAALLGRTLILPSPEFSYNYERLLNISHIQNCLGAGNTTVITFNDYIDSLGRHGHLHVNRFLCYMHDCYLDAGQEERLRKLGISWGKKEDAWPNEANIKIPSHPHASEIIEKFTCNDEVLGIGDVFYADVEAGWINQVGGPLAHTCKSLIQPHNFIISTAERFIQTYLGGDFVALHFRRYGFLTFCNDNSKKGYKCFFYPIPQAAGCISRIMALVASPVIYLSTDAQESETGLLQKLIYENGARIPLVQRPEHERGEKWDSPLQRHGLVGDKEVLAMLDKTICAMSNTFIGTPGSTFSSDIMRMRNEWGYASTCDEYLCQGEKPNFIAELN